MVVAILLQQSSPPPVVANQAPRIDGIVASARTVEPNATVSLRVIAHDPDPSDTLTYAWSATAGALDDAASTTPTWTAPSSEGTVTLTVGVTDPSGSRAAMNFEVDVVAHGGALVSTTFNTWPSVIAVSANPTRIDVGDSSSLDVTATDAENDALTYAWSASCAGTFSDAAAKAPSFTLGELSGEGCTLSLRVDDGMGGHAVGTLGIATGAAPAVDFAPVIDQAFQSIATVAAGETVVLRVTAHDPEGTAVTSSWSADAGSLADPTTAEGESQVIWTAPTPFTAAAHVTATVTDGAGTATNRVFTVTPLVACTNCSFETGDLTGWTVNDTAGAGVEVGQGGADGTYELQHRAGSAGAPHLHA